MSIKNISASSRITRTALMALSACVVSGQAMAALVCSSPNLTVPATIDGVYLNLITGVNGGSGSAVPGWDFNAYANSTGLNFFIPAGGAMVGSGSLASVLTTGQSVGPASPFTTIATGNTVLDATAFLAGGTLLGGISFVNEATSATNYGWMEFTTTAGTGANAGFPMTINRFCYDDAGAEVIAGNATVPVPYSYVPVPAVSTWSLLALAMLASLGGCVALRRRRFG